MSNKTFYIDPENADILDMPVDGSDITGYAHLICEVNFEEDFEESGGNTAHPIGTKIVYKKKGNNNFYLYIGDPDNGYIPHIHIFRTKEDMQAWRNGITIMILKAAYFDHGNNNMLFKTKKECQAVVDRLKGTVDMEDPFVPVTKSMTYWEYAIAVWNKCNREYPDKIIREDRIPKDMPVYSKDMPTYKESKKGAIT